jgi:tetratricopeptide (TPR) repeat protein
MMAERFLYLPSIGFCLLVGAGIEKGLKVHGVGESALGLAVLASLVFGLLTWNRTESWLNEYNFFRAMVWSSPESPMAHNNLANCHLRRGDFALAIREYEKTLALRPLSPPDTHIGLGRAYEACGRYEDAASTYRKAVEFNPTLVPIWVSLGNVYHQMERYSEAITAFQRALQFSPDLALAHYNIGNEFYTMGRLAEAERSYKEAVRLEPGLFYAWFMLGKIYERSNRTAEALASWQRCVELDGQGETGRQARARIAEVSQALFAKAERKGRGGKRR